MAEVILPGGLQSHAIDFNTSGARVEVADDNLILIFNDGGRIVFENLAALAEGEVRPEAAVTIETVVEVVRTPGRVGQSNDDAGDGQDVMDVNDFLIGPEGFITVLSGGKLMLDTSDDVGGEPGTNGIVVEVGIDNSAGGEFLPDTLVTVPDITLDYPARHPSWSNRPLANFTIESYPYP